MFGRDYETMKRKTKSRIAIAVALLAAIAALALGGFLLYCRMAARTDPSPKGTGIASFLEPTPEAKDDDGFPVVDWAHWKAVNPAVIGWITIPGTKVDAPILQASKADPNHYLRHDVYGNYNPHGAIFLDADCDDGLASRNAVILGHHFSGNPAAAPFGVIADYKDKAFAKGHAAILLQTPESKMRYEVRFAQIVKGWEPNKRTRFADDADYREWYADALGSASMVLDGQTRPAQTVSLVSCSYNHWKRNERTVVTASVEQTGENHR